MRFVPCARDQPRFRVLWLVMRRGWRLVTCYWTLLTSMTSGGEPTSSNQHRNSATRSIFSRAVSGVSRHARKLQAHHHGLAGGDGAECRPEV